MGLRGGGAWALEVRTARQFPRQSRPFREVWHRFRFPRNRDPHHSAGHRLGLGLGRDSAARCRDSRRVGAGAGGLGGRHVRDNTYPGCACDIPSHLYSFSFRLNPDWSHHYSKQPEIRAYLERVRDEYGLDRVLRFEVDCMRAEYDEARGRWTVHARDGRRFEARFLISGLGPLRIPRYPSVAGRERFAGPQMHSARWDASVELTGKRVGVVGSGASAIQIVPEIADQTAQLHVFQRTPPWVTPRLDGPISPRRRALLRAVPARSALARTALPAI